jgi:DDE superfamily endonuclease
MTLQLCNAVREIMFDQWGASVRKTAKILQQGTDAADKLASPSHSTIQNYIKRTGWGKTAYRAQTKPLLSPKNVADRKTFAQMAIDRGYRADNAESRELLRHVMFTDEAPMCLFPRPNRQNHRIRTDTNSKRIISLPKKGASVMVAGGMTAYGLTELHVVDHRSTITGEYYRNRIIPIYARALHDEPEPRLFPRPELATFQQDGAPAHTAAQSMDMLQRTFPVVWGKGVWPGNSPDLNPIEHVWAILRESIYKSPIPKSRQELVDRVQETWQGVDSDLVRSLVFSFPKRVAECLANDGGSTSY